MDSTVPNVPKTNYEAFRNAELGIMFQFNTQFEPSVIAQANLNITAGKRYFLKRHPLFFEVKSDFTKLVEL